MTEPLTIIGNYLSPYVRKVLLCLELKGIPYRIDPIAPFVGDDAFGRLSPLRRIPVLLDGDLRIWDSIAICEYASELAGGAGWPEEYGGAKLTKIQQAILNEELARAISAAVGLFLTPMEPLVSTFTS